MSSWADDDGGDWGNNAALSYEDQPSPSQSPRKRTNGRGSKHSSPKKSTPASASTGRLSTTLTVSANEPAPASHSVAKPDLGKPLSPSKTRSPARPRGRNTPKVSPAKAKNTINTEATSQPTSPSKSPRSGGRSPGRKPRNDGAPEGPAHVRDIHVRIEAPFVARQLGVLGQRQADNAAHNGAQQQEEAATNVNVDGNNGPSATIGSPKRNKQRNKQQSQKSLQQESKSFNGAQEANSDKGANRSNAHAPTATTVQNKGSNGPSTPTRNGKHATPPSTPNEKDTSNPTAANNRGSAAKTVGKQSHSDSRKQPQSNSRNSTPKKAPRNKAEESASWQLMSATATPQTMDADPKPNTSGNRSGNNPRASSKGSKIPKVKQSASQQPGKGSNTSRAASGGKQLTKAPPSTTDTTAISSTPKDTSKAKTSQAGASASDTRDQAQGNARNRHATADAVRESAEDNATVSSGRSPRRNKNRQRGMRKDYNNQASSAQKQKQVDPVQSAVHSKAKPPAAHANVSSGNDMASSVNSDQVEAGKQAPAKGSTNSAPNSPNKGSPKKKSNKQRSKKNASSSPRKPTVANADNSSDAHTPNTPLKALAANAANADKPQQPTSNADLRSTPQRPPKTSLSKPSTPLASLATPRSATRSGKPRDKSFRRKSARVRNELARAIVARAVAQAMVELGLQACVETTTKPLPSALDAVKNEATRANAASNEEPVGDLGTVMETNSTSDAALATDGHDTKNLSSAATKPTEPGTPTSTTPSKRNKKKKSKNKNKNKNKRQPSNSAANESQSVSANGIENIPDEAASPAEAPVVQSPVQAPESPVVPPSTPDTAPGTRSPPPTNLKSHRSTQRRSRINTGVKPAAGGFQQPESPSSFKTNQPLASTSTDLAEVEQPNPAVKKHLQFEDAGTPNARAPAFQTPSGLLIASTPIGSSGTYTPLSTSTLSNTSIAGQAHRSPNEIALKQSLRNMAGVMQEELQASAQTEAILAQLQQKNETLASDKQQLECNLETVKEQLQQAHDKAETSQASMQRELDRLQKSNNDLSEQVAALEASQASSDKGLQSLRETNAALEAQLAELTQDKEQVDTELQWARSHHEQQLAALRSEVKRYQEQLEQAAGATSANANSLKEWRDRALAAEDALKEMRLADEEEEEENDKRVKVIEAKLLSVQKELEQTVKRHGQAMEEAAKANATSMSELEQSHKQTMESQLQSKDKALADRSAELAQVKDQLQQQSQGDRTAELLADVDKLQAELQAAKAECKEALSGQNAMQASLDQSKAQVIELQKQLGARQQEHADALATQEALLRDMAAERDTLQARVDEGEQHKAVKPELDAAQQQISQLTKELEQQQGKVKQLEGDLAKQVENAQQKMSKQQQSHEDALKIAEAKHKAMLSEVKASYEAQSNKLTKTVAELESSLTEKTTMIRQLQAEMGSLQGKVEEIAPLSADADRLRKIISLYGLDPDQDVRRLEESTASGSPLSSPSRPGTPSTESQRHALEVLHTVVTQRPDVTGHVRVSGDERRVLKGLLAGLKVNKDGLVRIYQTLRKARTGTAPEQTVSDFSEAIALLKEEANRVEQQLNDAQAQPQGGIIGALSSFAALYTSAQARPT